MAIDLDQFRLEWDASKQLAGLPDQEQATAFSSVRPVWCDDGRQTVTGDRHYPGHLARFDRRDEARASQFLDASVKCSIYRQGKLPVRGPDAPGVRRINTKPPGPTGEWHGRTLWLECGIPP
jgi:hypothetical protein